MLSSFFKKGKEEASTAGRGSQWTLYTVKNADEKFALPKSLSEGCCWEKTVFKWVVSYAYSTMKRSLRKSSIYFICEELKRAAKRFLLFLIMDYGCILFLLHHLMDFLFKCSGGKSRLTLWCCRKWWGVSVSPVGGSLCWGLPCAAWLVLRWPLWPPHCPHTDPAPQGQSQSGSGVGKPSLDNRIIWIYCTSIIHSSNL